MTRSIEPWRGATDDAKIPDRVRLRIFTDHRGLCHRTGVKLRPGHWQLDHVIALCNGGTHSENNLAPISTEAHREKTATDVKVRAKIDRIRKREAGIKSAKPGGFRQWRGMDGTIRTKAT